MLANVGKRWQMSAKAGKCWLMQVNITNIGQCHLIVKKIHPWVRRRRQKNLKVQKNFKCQVGLVFFSNFWMFWTIRDPNLEKINKKNYFPCFHPTTTWQVVN